MVFVGVKIWGGSEIVGNKDNGKVGSIIHINTDYIKLVDEKKMRIYLDDKTWYRIDEESLEVFLYAVYGNEPQVKG